MLCLIALDTPIWCSLTCVIRLVREIFYKIRFSFCYCSEYFQKRVLHCLARSTTILNTVKCRKQRRDQFEEVKRKQNVKIQWNSEIELNEKRIFIVWVCYRYFSHCKLQISSTNGILCRIFCFCKLFFWIKNESCNLLLSREKCPFQWNIQLML